MTAPRRPPRLPAATHRPWLPTLLAALVVLVVIGAVVGSQLYWRDLHGSMSHMDQTLEHARQRQQAMISQFSEAQSLLLAQQRHLREAEAALREREAALAARQAAVEARLARDLATHRTRRELREQDEARRLGRELDLGIAALGDPGGADALVEGLEDLTDWAASADMVHGSALRPDLLRALAQTRDLLEAARAAGPEGIAERLRALRARALEVPPEARIHPYGHPRRVGNLGGGAQLTAQLDTAILAAERGDQAMFSLALDTAEAWIGAFYDGSRPEVSDLTAEIADLHRQRVVQDLDPLSRSAAQLRAVLGEIILGDTTPTAGDPAVGVPPSEG